MTVTRSQSFEEKNIQNWMALMHDFHENTVRPVIIEYEIIKNKILIYLTNRIDKRVEFFIKSHSPSAINNSAVDMSTKIHFYYIINTKHRWISGIGSIMSSTMIY